MEKSMLILALVAAICLLCLCGVGAVYFYRKERLLVRQLKELLDRAVGGNLEEEDFQERDISYIQGRLRRFLVDREELCRRLYNEKDQIQGQISDISHQAVIPISNILLYAQLLEESLDQTGAAGRGIGEAEDMQPEPEDGRKKGGSEEAFGELFHAPEEETRGYLTAIREQAENLDFLMEALVKLSRLERGILNIQAVRQPLAPLLGTLKNQLFPKAEKKNISLVIEKTDCQAVFDLKWTLEALSNIIDNGIKYTPEGGRVSVSVEELSTLVRVDVSDTGIGISKGEQAEIFTRFYRSRAVAEQPGVGIGLYLAREVMSAQNGYIKVSSRLGEGSVFSVYFLKDKERMSQN